jgi:hypothetical protein
MYDIRPIRPERLEAAKACVPEGCAEPDYMKCLGIEKDGELIGIIGAQMRHVVEPLYMRVHDSEAVLLAMGEIDGILRSAGAKEYEFFIQDKFKAFQNFIENRLPVEAEQPGKVYVRRLEPLNGQK